MQARAVDLIKVAPKPAARPGAAEPARPGADANEPKPRSRFDEELGRHTRPDKSPKSPDKAGSPQRESAAKTKPNRDADTQPVHDAGSADDNADADSTDAADAAAQSDDAPAKVEQSKTKSANKADAKKNAAADHDDADASDEAATAAAGAQPAKLPAADPTAAPVDDLVIDADAKKSDDKTDADADAATDSEAAAAQQLVAQQAAATAPTASPDQSTKATDAVDATASATTATAKATAPRPAAGRPGTPAATDESTEAVPRHAHAAKATGVQATDEVAAADAEAAGAFQLPPDAEKASSASSNAKDDTDAIAAAIQPTAPHEKAAAPLPPTTPQPAPPRDVAEHNVDQIVTSVRGELLTKGGTMDIRLDPPTLGHVQVQITVDDGVLSANIQTNNDEATRLLSHNLAQLKTQLESAGVTVDRIQVKQATPAEQPNSSSNQQGADGDSRQQSAASQDQSARHEQQRREALQRMWARVAGNGDPLDLVA